MKFDFVVYSDSRFVDENAGIECVLCDDFAIELHLGYIDYARYSATKLHPMFRCYIER